MTPLQVAQRFIAAYYDYSWNDSASLDPARRTAAWTTATYRAQLEQVAVGFEQGYRDDHVTSTVVRGLAGVTAQVATDTTPTDTETDVTATFVVASTAAGRLPVREELTAGLVLRRTPAGWRVDSVPQSPGP